MVDQLAGEYAAADEPVVFLEQNVDTSLGIRESRWWAAYGGGSAYLPLVMVDSGNQIDSGYVDDETTYSTYQAMVNAALARPPQAEISALSQRIGDRIHFEIQLTNLSGVPLSFDNAATVHAIVYEDHAPLDPFTDHITGRIVRAAPWTYITSPVAHGETATFTLETDDLTNVVDWGKIHAIVLADYRPGGTTGAYDMLQAAFVGTGAALAVSKQDTPDLVGPGEPLTYTIRVTNTGDVELHATISDTLPEHVTYAGPLVWTPTIAAPDSVWEHTFVVTVEAGYGGPLVNRVEVTTDEGVTGTCTATTNGIRVYLPLVLKGY